MKKYYFLLVLMFGINPVKAHEFLSQILVYSDEYDISEYQVVAHFILGQNDIEDVIKINKIYQDMKQLRDRVDPVGGEENKAASPGVCGPESSGTENKTCGVIDPFLKGRSVASNMCHAHAVANMLKFNLVPQYIAPQTFIDLDSASSDHHVDYDFSQGLEFNCVKVVTSNQNNTFVSKQ